MKILGSLVSGLLVVAFLVLLSACGGDDVSVSNEMLGSAPTTPAPDLTITVDSAGGDGTGVGIYYTITNNGSADMVSANFNVGFWDILASPPTSPAGAVATQAHTGISLAVGASTTSLYYYFSSGNISGTAYGFVDELDEVSEDDETNNASNGMGWAGGA